MVYAWCNSNILQWQMAVRYPDMLTGKMGIPGQRGFAVADFGASRSPTPAGVAEQSWVKLNDVTKAGFSDQWTAE